MERYFEARFLLDDISRVREIFKGLILHKFLRHLGKCLERYPNYIFGAIFERANVIYKINRMYTYPSKLVHPLSSVQCPDQAQD